VFTFANKIKINRISELFMTLADPYFGITSPEFEDKYKDGESKSTFTVPWKGRNVDLNVILVDIKDLRYNHNNGRLKPNLSQYLAGHGDKKDISELEIDVAATDWQKELHGFLCSNKERREAYDFFSKGTQQPTQNPLVSSSDGRVINGNQRLSVFRELHSSDPTKYAHLSHAYVAILNESDNHDEEEKLENFFQSEELDTADFDWIQNGLRDREKINAGMDHKTLGLMLGKRSEAEVMKLQHRILFASQFLVSIGKKNCWSWLRDQKLDQATETGSKIFMSLKNKSQQSAFCNAVFPIMKTPDSVKGHDGKSVHDIMNITKELIKKGMVKLPAESKEKKGKSKISTVRRKQKSEHLPEAITVSKDAEEAVKQLLEQKKTVSSAENALKDRNHTIKTLDDATLNLNRSLDNWDVQEVAGVKTKIKTLEKLLNNIKKKIDSSK
jgi:hypothetical protein